METSKQLKEIGFDEPCCLIWNTVNMTYEIFEHTCQKELAHEMISCPTHHQVLDWMFRTHDLYIQIEYNNRFGSDKKFSCKIIDTNGNITNRYSVHTYDTLFESYPEAVEFGIKCCIDFVLARVCRVVFRPDSLDKVFEIIDGNISQDDKKYIEDNGMPLAYHSTLGRWIRNSFELWTLDESNPELYKILSKKGYEHPDDMSNFILEEYIKHLKRNENKIPDEDYVPYEILSKIIRKGFPAMKATEWYGDEDDSYINESINKNHYPKVSQHQVLKWLKEKHDIFIKISILNEDDRKTTLETNQKKYYWNVVCFSTGKKVFLFNQYDGCGDTEFEIINEAIELCAEKLI